METSMTGWLIGKIKDRLQTLLWGAVANEVETESLLGYAASLDRIESAARGYEADGKPQLAEMIRRRAAQLDQDAPGGSALPALEHLGATDPAARAAAPKLTDESAATPPKRRRGRPRKDDPSNNR